MAGSVHLFATGKDEKLLLDHLEEGTRRRIFPWWSGGDEGFLRRDQFADHRHLGTLAIEIGEARWISRPDRDAPMNIERMSDRR